MERKQPKPRFFYILIFVKEGETLRELKVRVGFNKDGKVVFIEPLKRFPGKSVEKAILTARLLTEEEEFEDMEHLMQEGRMYKRVNRRVREIR